MDSELALASLSKNLAHHLVALRQTRSLTQAALAKLAGVPRSTVANLESGVGNPSLQNLARMATALQTSIEELLAPPRASCQLIAASELSVVKRAQGSVLVFKLLPDPIPGMEMDRMEFEPGARMGGVPHTAGTKEYLTCLQGEVSVTVAGEVFRVREGDVLAFPGERNHSYQNTGAKKAVCISVVALAPLGV